ncbi:hypothetical protein BpHYR1_048007 [Brachionus plicatilis]|uniref:Uncharacterized protein n=1 Tax=Brachionus plicatilis TaxID=10195 RepID=A0A3M7T9T9_BRAPC|nr:hypothetical protein BpHYR1_048007 [Brachionus plicatilis]
MECSSKAVRFKKEIKSSPKSLAEDVYYLIHLLCNKSCDESIISKVLNKKSSFVNQLETSELEDIFTAIKDVRINVRTSNTKIDELNKIVKSQDSQINNLIKENRDLRLTNDALINNMDSLLHKVLINEAINLTNSSLNFSLNSNQQKNYRQVRKNNTLLLLVVPMEKNLSSTKKYLKNSGKGENVGFMSCERKVDIYKGRID